MKKINHFIVLLCIFLFFILSCEQNSKDIFIYSYNFSCEFEVSDIPTGNKNENLAFVLQIPPEENFITNLSISSFQVLKNNELLWEQKNFEAIIAHNVWINDKGVQDSNYQLVLRCMPKDYNGSFSIGDKINVIFECKADRIINNDVNKYIIDNSETVGYWKNIGTIKKETQTVTADAENTEKKDNGSDNKNPKPDSVPPESEIKYIYNYSFNYYYKINIRPLALKPDNLILAYQMSKTEGVETNYRIKKLKVVLNGTTIKESSDEKNKFWYNEYSTSDGGKDANYMTLIKLLPENFNGQINVNDKISIQLEVSTDREFINQPIPVLIDNSAAANYWLVLGEETFNYPAESIPNEQITYNDISYKLVFYDDFNKDFLNLNPLKNGMYKQAFDMNKWWTEDWGSYVNVANGLEHRSIRDFKIHDGIAEFPMIKRKAAETGSLANAGPSIMTSIWDPKGFNSVPIYEFNKGIFEIKFMGPEGNNHPGQFTFWVLNYNTNFEAGSIPTNPKKADDGYALDEIDFFEYSPSLNMIRTGSRSCNGSTHRPSAGYSRVYLPSDFGGKWHVFRCVWDENGLASYLDGNKITEVPASSIKGFNNPNDKFMLLISSQSIKESGIDGNVDSNFEPYSYYVDYVKVYEKE